MSDPNTPLGPVSADAVQSVKTTRDRPDIYLPPQHVRWGQDFRPEQVIVTQSYTRGRVHFVGSAIYGGQVIRSVSATRMRGDPWVQMEVPVRDGVVFRFDEAIHDLRFWNWSEFWTEVHRHALGARSAPEFLPRSNVIAFPAKVR